jgi:hypothetical protein
MLLVCYLEDGHKEGLYHFRFASAKTLHARWKAVKDDEHAVSTVMLGPFKS